MASAKPSLLPPSTEQVDEVLNRIPPRTDQGNGERLARASRRDGIGDLRYAHGLGWMVWDGRRWNRDRGDAAVQTTAKRVVRAIYDEEAGALFKIARDIPDGPQRDRVKSRADELAKWEVVSESQTRRDAMIKSARSEPQIRVNVEDMDADAYLLNCQNGILDLRTLVLRKHDPAALMTRLASASYDPDAACPFFQSCLRMFVPDEATRNYLQRAAAYIAQGIPSEYLFVLEGPTGGWKTGFLDALRGALGDYARVLTSEVLTAKKGSISAGEESQLAQLRGARLAVVSETERGKRLAESLMKQLTGEHTLVAKFMRQDPFEFENTVGVIIATNEPLTVQGDDAAIWRRFRVVPFYVSVVEEADDDERTVRPPGYGTDALVRLDRDEVIRRLVRELDGILTWVVRGRLLMEQGRMEDSPPQVIEATAAYRKQMDQVLRFIDERVVVDPNAPPLVSDAFFKAYQLWASAAGVQHPVSKVSFSKRVGSKFATGRQTINGKQERVYMGIRVAAPLEEMPLP